MKRWSIIIGLVIFMVIVITQLGYCWSKAIKIAENSSFSLSPFQVTGSSNIWVGYYDATEQVYHVYYTDQRAMYSNKDFREFITYSYTEGIQKDFNLIQIGDKLGIFWIDIVAEQERIVGAIFDGTGNLAFQQIIVAKEVNLRDLYVYSWGPEMYLCWVEDVSPNRLLSQKLIYTPEEFVQETVREVTQGKLIYFPRAVKDHAGVIHYIWKNDVWKGGEGITYDILYATLNLQGEVSDPIYFGHSVGLIMEERPYDEVDIGPQLIYDEKNDQVIGVWAGSDSLVRLTFTAPSIAPYVSIIKDGEFIVKDQPIFSAKSVGHYPDVAIDPDGQIYVTWTDDVKNNTSKVYVAPLFDLIQYSRQNLANQATSEQELVLLTSPAIGSYYSGFSRILIDSIGKIHLLWWEVAADTSKLIYRNNRDGIPLAEFSRLGLEPESDDFTLKKVVTHVVFLLGSVLVLGGVYTFLNLVNIIFVIVIFGGLKRLGFEKIFRQHPLVLLFGMIIVLFSLYAPWNGFFVATNVLSGYYWLGASVATILVVFYWRMKQKPLTDVLVMLEMLLLWSFWGHLVVVYPVAIRLVG